MGEKVGTGGKGEALHSLLLHFVINVKQSQKKLLFLSKHMHTPNRQVSQWKALALSEPASPSMKQRPPRSVLPGL